ncbi:hypothetical protein [Parascardovia denticolens]|uniref:hypothetical protein n=1 Tax=Parascardovia denticolens TaxID=78258 RepID=UPI00117E1995|nr:hypothetical protein [Parascardovia denticolens]
MGEQSSRLRFQGLCRGFRLFSTFPSSVLLIILPCVLPIALVVSLPSSLLPRFFSPSFLLPDFFLPALSDVLSISTMSRRIHFYLFSALFFPCPEGRF